jgi:hypothetical protein
VLWDYLLCQWAVLLWEYLLCQQPGLLWERGHLHLLCQRADLLQHSERLDLLQWDLYGNSGESDLLRGRQRLRHRLLHRRSVLRRRHVRQ